MADAAAIILATSGFNSESTPGSFNGGGDFDPLITGLFVTAGVLSILTIAAIVGVTLYGGY